MATLENDFYTLEDLAEKLKVSTEWIGEQVEKGNLIKCKLGKRSYFLHSDVMAFVEKGRVENIEDAKPKKVSTYKPTPSGRKAKPNIEGVE
jgi:hypothetical protein